MGHQLCRLAKVAKDICRVKEHIELFEKAEKETDKKAGKKRTKKTLVEAVKSINSRLKGEGGI